MKSTTELIKEIQKITEEYLARVKATQYIDMGERITITEVGKEILKERFSKGKTMNLLPDCTIKIVISGDTVKVVVFHRGDIFAEFNPRRIDCLDAIFEFPGTSLRLDLD